MGAMVVIRVHGECGQRVPRDESIDLKNTLPGSIVNAKGSLPSKEMIVTYPVRLSFSIPGKCKKSCSTTDFTRLGLLIQSKILLCM